MKTALYGEHTQRPLCLEMLELSTRQRPRRPCKRGPPSAAVPPQPPRGRRSRQSAAWGPSFASGWAGASRTGLPVRVQELEHPDASHACCLRAALTLGTVTPHAAVALGRGEGHRREPGQPCPRERTQAQSQNRETGVAAEHAQSGTKGAAFESQLHPS